MICKHCGANLAPNETVCSYCRCQVEEISTPPPQFSSSARALPPQPVYSSPNYLAHANDNQNQLSPKNKTSALLLCLLGLCGLNGLHRFYSGKVFTGLLWIFTGGLCGLGTFVDILLLLTDNFRDKDGRLLK